MFLKKNKNIVFWVFGIALVFRLIIAHWALNGDLLTQSEWGKWEYMNGTKGLYDWNKWLNEWPNHPPLMSMVYLWAFQLHSFLMMIFSNLGNFIALNRLAPHKLFWWFFDFTKWFGGATYENRDFLQGIVLTIKMQMMVADLLIGGVIYFLCKKLKVDWKKYVIAYLFLPFSWYLSALYGQSDQLAFLFLIISFILLNTDFFEFGPLLFAISINLKPTGLMLVPLFLWVWYKQKKSTKDLIVGGVAALVFTFWITSFFTNKMPWDFWMQDLWKRLFLVKSPFTTVSAFNFWYIFHAKDLVPEMTKYLFLSAKVWGEIAFVIVSIIAFFQVKYKKLETVFMAMFTSGFGAWLFMTNMYERYLFTGLVSLLFLSIYRKKLFKYFVILSVIYLFNMYNGWWFPYKFVLGKELFLWDSRLITRIFSAINVFIYGYVLWLVRDAYWPQMKTFFKKFGKIGSQMRV